jgi:squalene synthase HpnD
MSAGAATVNAATALPAAGSSFYLGMRILPRPRREAMYAIYAFCRAVDDIADGVAPRPERLAELEHWRADIDALFDGKTAECAPLLAEPVRRFTLRREDFHAVIDGMAMDAEADIVAPDWATLDLYCDRVASAVGRLSTRVFGLGDREGRALAHHLGRALQLTNILRDLDEDRGMGRLYLPREAVAGAGISPTSIDAVLDDPRLDEACKPVAGRALDHFKEAGAIMDAAPRRLVRAPRLMGAVYRDVLDRLIVRGFRPPRPRVGASRMKALGALARYGFV